MDAFRRQTPSRFKGRGSGDNPPNRFKPIWFETDDDCQDFERPAPETRFFTDASKSILSTNDSPDVGFDASLNPYRGCEHGCVYCFARPTHEYFELSAGLDFETKILVKENAPELLERELDSPRWKPRVVALSGVTDCYQPGERKFRITRRCLEVLLKFRNPAFIVTKNRMVTRDIDLLRELARFHCVAVYVSLTTLDAGLMRLLEPRASLPAHRLEAIRALSSAGIPVGVLTAPMIPALNDHELPSLIERAARAGARFAGHVMLRLPRGVKELFARWLETHFPNKKEKVLNRIRAARGGNLNDPRFSSRMKGEGIFAEQIAAMFSLACRKAGIAGNGPELTTDNFINNRNRQLSLFQPPLEKEIRQGIRV